MTGQEPSELRLAGVGKSDIQRPENEGRFGQNNVAESAASIYCSSMTYARHGLNDKIENPFRLPLWVTSVRAESIEDIAFLSGAALSHLHAVLARADVPQALLRERLALRAAESCVAYSGRAERANELRDEVVFLQPGDRPGPAGEVYLSWRKVVERPFTLKRLYGVLPRAQSLPWADAKGVPPVNSAASILERILEERLGASAALVMADVALARGLGWSHVIPLFGFGLKRGDLQKSGTDLRLACHRAILMAVPEAIREAEELARRAAKARAVAPKLRARGAEEALALFLSRDAVAPSSLVSLRSGRAARRFCDRLVELGAARELTGRDTFRLYGL